MAMAKILYPVGIQDFRKLREFGYLYVDKTAYIHDLANPGGSFFLSRPRRFGKSLLISTMEQYFRGNRELFRGLAIDLLEPEEWTKYPVLHLDFTRGGYKNPGDLELFLEKTVSEWEMEYGISESKYSPELRFDTIIRHLYRQTGQRVVILIDEYDSPVIDSYGNPELEADNRRTLHDFYRVMKANEGILKFVFLTGVGKLGQLSIFSGFNNLSDISLLPDYSAICGITTEELLSNFHEGIEDLGKKNGWSFDETLLSLKKQYDGYHFSENLVDIYNPFSLLKALDFQKIGNYWFQTGTPTRLINQFLRNDWGTLDLDGTIVSESRLSSGDVLGNNLALACFYTGYLTIKAYDSEEDEFTLGYPNTEVRDGFFKDLMNAVQGENANCSEDFVRSLKRFIKQNNIDGFLHELQSFLAGIPYMSETNRESQWQKDILIIARLVGMNVDVERRTSCGRMDMVMESPKAIYIIEFKYGATPEEALAQINEKDYALQYENTLNPKPIVKVGVNISPKTRNIDGWSIQN